MKFVARLKHVVVELAMEGVLEAVRGYLDEKLKPVTPEHLYKAIKEDADPWDYADKQVKIRGRRWAQKLRKRKNRLTPELVLEWLKKDRPDLASLIINMGSEGKKWLVRWTERTKNKLWPTKTSLKLVRAREEAAEEPEEPEDKGAPEQGQIRWV